MIRPPRSFKVLGQIAHLRVVPREHGKAYADGEDCIGANNLDAGQVFVVEGLGPTQEQATVLHEVMHSIMYWHHLRVYLKDTSEETDEAFVHALAPALLAFLRDNPRLVTYLTQRLPA